MKNCVICKNGIQEYELWYSPEGYVHKEPCRVEREKRIFAAKEAIQPGMLVKFNGVACRVLDDYRDTVNGFCAYYRMEGGKIVGCGTQSPDFRLHLSEVRVSTRDLPKPLELMNKALVQCND